MSEWTNAAGIGRAGSRGLTSMQGLQDAGLAARGYSTKPPPRPSRPSDRHEPTVSPTWRSRARQLTGRTTEIKIETPSSVPHHEGVLNETDPDRLGTRARRFQL